MKAGIKYKGIVGKECSDGSYCVDLAGNDGISELEARWHAPMHFDDPSIREGCVIEFVMNHAGQVNILSITA